MSKKYTVVELKKICKSKGIKGYGKMRKAELLKVCLKINKSKTPNKLEKCLEENKRLNKLLNKPKPKTPKSKTPKSKTPKKINKDSVEYFNNFFNEYLSDMQFNKELIIELFRRQVKGLKMNMDESDLKKILKKNKKLLFKKYNKSKTMKFRSYTYDVKKDKWGYILKTVDSTNIIEIIKGVHELKKIQERISERESYFIGFVDYDKDKKLYNIAFES
jgi:hypothetical protein